MSRKTEIGLRCSNISKYFGEKHGRITAVSDVTFDLFLGEVTMLVGPSGSGKTSLLAALGGLQAPDEGSVVAFEENIWASSDRSARRFRERYCGFVFQSVGLFPALTAFEQVAIPLTYLGHSSQVAKARAQEMLIQVGLKDRLKSKPHELSGGENQRVAIARMLAKNPKLIFCDEPTSALDGENGANISELLVEIAKENNTMVFCVTHDERLMRYADRILKIQDGVIIDDVRPRIEHHEIFS